MLVQFLQAHADNAVNGKMGALLDSLVVYGEAMVWGGTLQNGTTTTSAAGLMVGLASALGGIFCIILAANIAFKTMAEGERIDVLAILKPIVLALVLANWYGICAGLYHVFKPVENRFKYVYEWSNDRVDSLRHRRDTLTFVMRGEVEQAKSELIISEIRQRYGIEEEKEEQPQDGDLIVHGMEVSVNEVEFGDILHNEMNTQVDAEGNEKPQTDIKELMENAGRFSWVEDVLVWIAEVIWSTGLYVIFLVKYLYLFVLVMFGPVFMVCSILPTWKDAWSQWVSKYVVVGMYGTAAYLCLIFGLMIIEATTNADIHTFEKAMLSEESFYSYIQMASRFEGLSSVGMYFIALLVTSIALGMSFELAGLVFPGDIKRGAGEFYGGMMGYIQAKMEQAKEAAVAVAATVATGGAALAAKAVEKSMEDEMEEERQLEDEQNARMAQDEQQQQTNTARSNDATASTRTSTHKKDEWLEDADADERERQQQEDLEDSLGGPDAESVKISKMTEDANKWADRQAWMNLMGPAYHLTGEDLAADIRDNAKLQEAREKGIGTEFEEMRNNRLRENMFLMQVVRTQATTNSSLTRKQKKLIEKYGIEKAMKKDKDIRYKLLTGMPRLTSPGALFRRDTLTSPREHRQMLKRLGLYKHALRAEFLRRFAKALIRPGYVQKTKLFFFLTIRKKDKTFRNALQKRLYNSAMSHLLNTEALMALKCREELAKRDIQVDAHGKPVRLKGFPPYWQQDMDYAAYTEARRRGGAVFENEQLNWFNERYGDINEAKNLEMQLMVFEAKKRAGDADDFVLERQMQARDENEINLWKNINERYEAYKQAKTNVQSILKKVQNNKS